MGSNPSGGVFLTHSGRSCPPPGAEKQFLPPPEVAHIGRSRKPVFGPGRSSGRELGPAWGPWDRANLAPPPAQSPSRRPPGRVIFRRGLVRSCRPPAASGPVPGVPGSRCLPGPVTRPCPDLVLPSAWSVFFTPVNDHTPPPAGGRPGSRRRPSPPRPGPGAAPPAYIYPYTPYICARARAWLYVCSPAWVYSCIYIYICNTWVDQTLLLSICVAVTQPIVSQHKCCDRS